MIKSVFSLFIFSLALNLMAAEYFVNNSHAEASNENPGTSEKPFKHIQAAIDKVKPGDIITVKAGTYRETILWKNPGTAGKRITLRAADGETVVIKGSVEVKGWEKSSSKELGLKNKYPRENIWIKNGWEKKTIYPADEPNWKSKIGPWFRVDPRWAFWKDAVMKGAGFIDFAFKKEELQEDRIYYDKENKRLIIWLTPKIDPNQNGIEVCVRPVLMTGKRNFLHVKGFQWRHANTRNLTNWPALSVGSNCIFEDNIISWCDYIGFSVFGDDSIIRKNVIAFNGSAGIGGRGNRHLIEDNKVLYNNVNRHDTFLSAGGGKWVFLKDSIIRRHEAAYNNGAGMWLDIDNTNNVFDSCYFHHNHGSGLFIEISPNNIIKNCVFAYNTEMPGGMRIKWEHHHEAVTRLRNRYYTERGDLGWGAYNSSSQGTKWLNNLFYCNQNAGLVCAGTWRVDGSVKDIKLKQPEKGKYKGWTTTRNVTVMNNIFAGNGGSQLIMLTPKTHEDCTGNKSDYNLFDIPMWTGASVGGEGIIGPFYKKLEAWREATGWDKHSLEANSEMTLPAGGDFRPTLLSPANDKGITVEEVTHDFLGNPRPVGKAFDIGPFERFSILELNATEGVPTGLKFLSVDMKAVLNRTLNDEKANDGEGGWSDQGPACDLSSFTKVLPSDPVGNPKGGMARLAGINFTLEYPKSVLVLNPKGKRPGPALDKVDIPVNQTADWLFFLHGTAWGGSWDYIVTYEDGTKETVKVSCPENMRDWASGSTAPFRMEKGTRTDAAWTGKTGSFPIVAIYRMAWKNPKPKKLIKSITMEGLKGVPALFAISIGKK